MLPKQKCLSRGNTSFFWPTSLIPFCPEFKPPNPLFPRTSQYFLQPSTLQSCSPQKHFCPNKCHLKVRSLISRHSSSSHPSALICPLFSSCTGPNPYFCLRSLWREQAWVLKNVLKKSSQTCTVFIWKGERKPKAKQTNKKSNKYISDTDKKLFLHLPGYLLMDEYDTLYNFFSPQGNSRQCLPSMRCNSVRGSKKHYEGARISFWYRSSMGSSVQGYTWGAVEVV